MRRFCLFPLTLLVFVFGCSRDPNVVKAEYLRSGDEYMKAGKAAEALIEYTNAVRVDVSSGEARFKMAESRLALGDKKAAFPEFIRAADLLPDDVEAQLRAGHLLLSGGFFEEARERARAALKKQPQNVTALVLLGNTLAGMKNLEDAVLVLERALTVDPRLPGVHINIGVLKLAMGDRPGAEASFLEAVQISGGAPDAELSLANFYLSVNRGADAERVLTAARQRHPRDVALNRALGAFYVQADRLGEAEEAFKTVASADGNASARFALAAFYAWSGRDDEAIATLRVSSSDSAVFNEAQQQLALLHLYRGRLDDANEAIDAALARDRRNAAAMTIKARLLLASNQLSEALEQVREALRVTPSLAEAHLTLGHILSRLRDFQGARAAFTETVKLDPQSVPALLELSALHLQRLEIDSAIQRAEQAVALGRHNPVAQIALARALAERPEEFPRVERMVAGLLKAFPNVPAVHIAAASFSLRAGNEAAARRAFETALALDPRSSSAAAGLIALDIAHKQPQKAQVRAEALVNARPNDAEPLLLLANVYGLTGQIDKTEETLREALRVDPSNPSIVSLLGALYMRQNRVDEAIREFEEVARLEPKSVGAATLLGHMHFARRDTLAAERWWKRALEVDPGAAAAANNLAWLYAERRENLEAALQLAIVAKSKYPMSPEILDTVGWVYLRKNMAAFSLSYFEQSIQLDPDNPVYHYHLGKAFAERGDDAKARRSLERALALDASFPYAADAKKVIESLVF